MNDAKHPEKGTRGPAPETARDPVLGDALRHALDSPENPAFVARVLAALDASPAPLTLWDLLAAWARRGIPVALALALMAAVFATSHRAPAASLDEALTSGETEAAAALLSGHEPPETGILFVEPNGQ